MNLKEFRENPKADRPHYLLFGHPMGHSWSPLMHNTALQHFGIEATYYAIDLPGSQLGDLAGFLNRETFLGANVTIPYKQTIISYLDSITNSAEEIEAVNTIVKQNHRLKGYNTDYDGFLSPLADYTDKLEGTGAIVFGTGGATRAIVWALKDLGIEMIYLVSRTPNRISSFDDFPGMQVISYHQWTSFADETELIVNATPLGMYPNVNESPIRDSETEWLENHICYDIVYNPRDTKFLKQASRAGATTIGGVEMLIEQGSESFELWTGRSFPVDKIKNILYDKFGN